MIVDDYLDPRSRVRASQVSPVHCFPAVVADVLCDFDMCREADLLPKQFHVASAARTSGHGTDLQSMTQALNKLAVSFEIANKGFTLGRCTQLIAAGAGIILLLRGPPGRAGHAVRFLGQTVELGAATRENPLGIFVRLFDPERGRNPFALPEFMGEAEFWTRLRGATALALYPRRQPEECRSW